MAVKENNITVNTQTLSDFMAELESRKIKLWLDGDALRYKAPKEVITDELIKNLKERKAEIIAFLQERKIDQILYEAIPPVPPQEYYPLSPAQKRMYIMNRVDKESTSYNIVNVLKVNGELDRQKLREVFTQLLSRHESLRTSFTILDGNPVQIVHQKVDFDLVYKELNGKEAQIDQQINEFIHPYDLARAPLFRLMLLKLIKPDGAVLSFIFLDMHHIISDGTSSAVLVKDFNNLYEGKTLPALKVQYKDYVAWYEKLLASDIVKNQKKYWLEQMQGEIPVSNFPTDYPRPAQFDFRGASVSYQLDRSFTDSLYSLARENRVTFYSVLLTAYYILLEKYTGQNDIIIGTPNAGRRHEDTFNMMGMFVNTLALRNYPEPGKTFKVFMKEVGLNVIKSFDRQDYPFEQLVEDLNIQRDPARNPVFDMMFVLQNIDVDEVKAEGFETSRYEFNRGIIQYDITISATENKEGVKIEIHYCAALFKKESIEALGKYFKNILEAAVFDPDIKLSEIEILTTAEKSRLLYDFNNTEAAYPKDKTITQLFEEQVKKTPEHIAVQFGNLRLTYGELNNRAGMLANYLRMEHNVNPESLVGVMMDKSEDMLVTAIGILKAGGAYVPIDPEYPGERIKTMIDDSGVAVIISGKKHIKILNKLQWECKGFKAFLCMDSDNIYAEVEEEKSELMSKDVWEYVGANAADDIAAGAWVSSYTGEDLSKEEMDEYSGNVLKKLRPYLHKDVKILEVGCASGLSMYKIAPFVGMYYGTDLSEVIIGKNRERIARESIKNIKLKCLPAHEIDLIDENGFDIVIMNSVIQCFHGHNYLRGVIAKAIGLMKDQGVLFIGDVMNEEQREELIQSLTAFKQNNPNSNYRTKTDWSVELFLAKGFFEDLKYELPEIKEVEFSDKIHTIANELTRFRYDAALNINKTVATEKSVVKKHKIQHGIDAVRKYESLPAPPSEANPHNAAYVIYTSGTTGKPKGVLIEHRNVVRLMFNSKMQFDFSDRDVWTMFHSFSFDFSVWEMYGALLYGGKLVVIPKSVARDTREYLKTLKKEKVTILNQTPGAFYNLIDAEMEFKENELSLRYVIFGGEALKPVMLKEWQKKYPGVKLINMYGITETTVHVTYKEITFFEIERNISNIGRPIPTLTAYVMDRNMRLLPVGVPGELCVGGDGVGRGYLYRPELTAERFVQNPYRPLERLYRSGDLVKMLSDGDMEYLGRIDQQVKIRGHRIELGEIEAALLKNNLLKEAVVLAREVENGEKYICAYYVAENEFTVAEFKEYLCIELPDYALPSYFVRMEALPLTSNGKVNKKLLPDPFANINTGVKYEAPTNDTEKKLAEEWKTLLSLDRIGINDNFFEMGGHSLKATIFASRAHKLFNVELPLAEIFKTPTIKELAQYIKNAGESIYKSIKPVGEKEYYALSSAQKRLFLIKMIEGASITYNMSGAIVIEGDLDVPRFEETYKKLINRHESLRTSFELINGEPVQIIHKTAAFTLTYVSAPEETVKDVIREFIIPYDLSKAPLIRACLVKLAAGRHILVSDMHHIISDGVSLDILTKDFISLYNGRLLTGLRIQYKDFAQWQNDLFKTDAIEKQKKYWLDTFSGEIPVLNMPTDYPRPSQQNFAGESLHFEINSALAAGFETIKLKTGATTYMVLLAAFNVLLSKYAGQEDIVVGSPISGRRHPDLENIIGMFVNTLAMRNYPENNKTFLQFLTEVKENSLKAYENQDYQFEELVENLNIKRDISRNPIFDTMFVLQNMNTGKLSIEGLNFKPYEFDTGVAKFDITLLTVEDDDKIQCVLEYCAKLFAKETMKRFMAHFINVLQAISKDATVKLSDIVILTEEEKNSILYTFNNTRAEYPKDKTIHELFEEQAAKTPDNIAAVFEDKQLTYKELNEKANQLAGLLRRKGAAPDNIIAIMVERSLEMIIGIMGILKSGGAYLPIDPEYPEARIRYMLEDSNTKMLLTKGRYIDHPGVNPGCGDIIGLEGEAFSTESVANLEHINNSADIAYIIYTSGSTGKPKGVMVEHHSLINRLNWMQKKYPIGEDDVILQKTPYTFDVSLWELFWWSMQGATVCFLKPGGEKDPGEISAAIKKNNVTTIHFVPSMLNMFLEFVAQGTQTDRLKTLRQVFASGEALTEQQVNKFNNLQYTKRQIKLYNLYGPTEATVDVSYFDCPAGEEPSLTPGIIPIGKPIDNINLYVLGKNNKLQPVGVPGELHISGDGLARGYLNRPELTAEKFIPNPFVEVDAPQGTRLQRIYKTGDLARWLPDGNIEFMGRIDHQVKIRGNRIELGEIEARLLRHEGIKEAVVITGEDKDHQRYLCAYFVPGISVDAFPETSLQELRAFLLKELPEYMIPAYFVKLDKLPLTPNGKIDRKALADPGKYPGLAMALGANAVYEAPVNEMERKLAEIWREVLGIEKVGVNDSFFELGGDSIKAIQVLARLSKYDMKLEIKDLFTNPRIRELKKYVKTGGISRNQGVIEGEMPLTPIQRWFFEEVTIDKHYFNQAVMLYKKDGFDETIIKIVFTAIIAHHDALRTVYRADGDKIIQYNQGIEENLFDLRIKEITEQECEERITKECEQLHSSIDLGAGPLVKLGLFKTANGDHLLITIHHLVIDGVSWRIILEDFAQGYGQIQRGEEIRFQDKTDPYLEWAMRLNQYTNSEALHEEADYWRKIVEPGIGRLKRDGERKAGRNEQGRIVSVALGGAETQELLMKVNHAYNTEINDILLTALGMALKEYSGEDKVLIALEGHGREAIMDGIDINRTVGWFTSLYPVLLDMSHSEDLTYQIKTVKESLRKIPHKGIGYGIIKYLTDAGKTPAFGLQPYLRFNYLGQFDSEIENGIFERSKLNPGVSISKKSKRHYAIDISGAIIGGRLEISIDYDSDEFEKPTMERLAGCYLEKIVALIKHCAARQATELTTSDLSSKGISLDEINKVYRILGKK